MRDEPSPLGTQASDLALRQDSPDFPDFLASIGLGLLESSLLSPSPSPSPSPPLPSLPALPLPNGSRDNATPTNPMPAGNATPTANGNMSTPIANGSIFSDHNATSTAVASDNNDASAVLRDLIGRLDQDQRVPPTGNGNDRDVTPTASRRDCNATPTVNGNNNVVTALPEVTAQLNQPASPTANGNNEDANTVLHHLTAQLGENQPVPPTANGNNNGIAAAVPDVTAQMDQNRPASPSANGNEPDSADLDRQQRAFSVASTSSSIIFLPTPPRPPPPEPIDVDALPDTPEPIKPVEQRDEDGPPPSKRPKREHIDESLDSQDAARRSRRVSAMARPDYRLRRPPRTADPTPLLPSGSLPATQNASLPSTQNASLPSTQQPPSSTQAKPKPKMYKSKKQPAVWVPPRGIDKPVQRFGPHVPRNPCAPTVSSLNLDGDAAVPGHADVDGADAPPSSLPLAPQATTRACEVQMMGGDRGRGLVATRDLSAGEVILAEKPIFTAKRDCGVNELLAKVKDMSPAWLMLLLSFECSGGYLPAIEGILQANGIPCVEDEDGEDEEPLMGVFEFISRINHSCSPNAGWAWSDADQRMLLVACRPIPKGQELVAWYTDNDSLLEPRAKRRAMLADLLKFDCECHVCSAPRADITASDARRRRIATIIARWKGKHFDETFFADPYVLEEAVEAGSLAHLEGLVSPLIEIYLYQFYIFAVWGRKEQAKDAAKYSFRALVCANGRTFAKKHFIAKLIKEPERWESYGYMVPAPAK